MCLSGYMSGGGGPEPDFSQLVVSSGVGVHRCLSLNTRTQHARNKYTDSGKVVQQMFKKQQTLVARCYHDACIWLYSSLPEILNV